MTYLWPHVGLYLVFLLVVNDQHVLLLHFSVLLGQLVGLLTAWVSQWDGIHHRVTLRSSSGGGGGIFHHWRWFRSKHVIAAVGFTRHLFAEHLLLWLNLQMLDLYIMSQLTVSNVWLQAAYLTVNLIWSTIWISIFHNLNHHSHIYSHYIIKTSVSFPLVHFKRHHWNFDHPLSPGI